MKGSIRSAVVLALGLSLLGTPAHADTFEWLTFSAPNPCATACPHWTGLMRDESGGIINGLGPPDVEMADAPCAPNPVTVPGSYAEKLVLIPTWARYLSWSINPTIDFDSFLCAQTTFGTPTAPRYTLATGTNTVDDLCLVACRETIFFEVGTRQGTAVILRVYNWLDSTGTVSGSLAFLT